jgi:Tol biopolymer transport system component
LQGNGCKLSKAWAICSIKGDKGAKGGMARLYVSFSIRDEMAARGLAGRLREKGFETILPRREPGYEKGNIKPVQARTERELDASDIVIFMVTPFWRASAICNHELEYSINGQKSMLAVIEAPTSAGIGGSMVKIIDMGRNREKGLDELFSRIDEELASRRGARGGGGVGAAARAGGVAPPLQQQGFVRIGEKRKDGASAAGEGAKAVRGLKGNPLSRLVPAPVQDRLAAALKSLREVAARRREKKREIKLHQRRLERLRKRQGEQKGGDNDFLSRFANSRAGLALAGFTLVTALLWLSLDHDFGEGAKKDKELAAARKRQSMMLVKMASKVMHDGDGETALLLALEAMERANDEELRLRTRNILYQSLMARREKSVLRGHDHHVSSAAFSPDGKLAVSSSWDGTVILWDLAKGKIARRFGPYRGFVNDAAFSRDGAMLAIATLDGAVRLLSVRSGKLVHVMKGEGHNHGSVAFSPDGSKIAAASSDRSVRIWESASGALLRAFVVHSKSVESVMFSPDGRHILTSSLDGSAKIIAAGSGKVLATLKNGDKPLRHAAYDREGRYIITAGEDGDAALWDGRNGLLKRVFRGKGQAMLDAEISPSGKYVLTGSKGFFARLWKMDDGREWLRLAGHEGIVTSVSFSPDGALAMTSSGDGSIRLWPLPSSDAELVEMARRQVSHCLSPALRKKYYLGEKPPSWCVEMKKYPYNSRKWRERKN